MPARCRGWGARRSAGSVDWFWACRCKRRRSMGAYAASSRSGEWRGMFRALRRPIATRRAPVACAFATGCGSTGSGTGGWRGPWSGQGRGTSTGGGGVRHCSVCDARVWLNTGAGRARGTRRASASRGTFAGSCPFVLFLQPCLLLVLLVFLSSRLPLSSVFTSHLPPSVCSLSICPHSPFSPILRHLSRSPRSLPMSRSQSPRNFSLPSSSAALRLSLRRCHLWSRLRRRSGRSFLPRFHPWIAVTWPRRTGELP